MERMEAEATGPLTPDEVREIIQQRWPCRFTDEELGDGVPLGDQGLGLDSIELVEIVLACEEATGVSATEELVRRQPLTIDGLVGFFATG